MFSYLPALKPSAPYNNNQPHMHSNAIDRWRRAHTILFRHSRKNVKMKDRHGDSKEV